MVKLVCLKCKVERELTEDETKEVGEFIFKKGMKAISLVKYWNLADGETCEGRDHRYVLAPDFLKEISEKVQNAKDVKDKITKNTDEITDLEKKIEEMRKRVEELNTETESLTDDFKVKEDEIYESTHITWNKWI